MEEYCTAPSPWLCLPCSCCTALTSRGGESSKVPRFSSGRRLATWCLRWEEPCKGGSGLLRSFVMTQVKPRPKILPALQPAPTSGCIWQVSNWNCSWTKTQGITPEVVSWHVLPPFPPSLQKTQQCYSPFFQYKVNCHVLARHLSQTAIANAVWVAQHIMAGPFISQLLQFQ